MDATEHSILSHGEFWTGIIAATLFWFVIPIVIGVGAVIAKKIRKASGECVTPLKRDEKGRWKRPEDKPSGKR